ncbi:AbrB family transcriptional regulator [Afipia sp. P52-10]|uniref:hypothetical protein n=1 Tax=Afipia sp. P52-10 TaxID=1429916 RepID=UPI0003DF3F3B|nr:hypothetical protein [Afipia sp. P52-10]ETR77535.1 AbrB family transcriptional regulator [Afipia sp. P52-10]
MSRPEIGRLPDPFRSRIGVRARLDEDFAQRPERSIVTVPAALLDRAAMLTQGMEVELDAEIEGDVKL